MTNRTAVFCCGVYYIVSVFPPDLSPATYLLVSQSRQGRVEPVEFRALCWFGGR